MLRHRRGRNSKRSLFIFFFSRYYPAAAESGPVSTIDVFPSYFPKANCCLCVRVFTLGRRRLHFRFTLLDGIRPYLPASGRIERDVVYSNELYFVFFPSKEEERERKRGLRRGRATGCWFVVERKLNSYRRNQHGWRYQTGHRAS